MVDMTQRPHTHQFQPPYLLSNSTPNNPTQTEESFWYYKDKVIQMTLSLGCENIHPQ
uniref:Uncharacterized protein n=1 Tax=Octopus bimaculoides TaxID=37653 RepID=A0A0L8H2W1_OCTBM